MGDGSPLQSPFGASRANKNACDKAWRALLEAWSLDVRVVAGRFNIPRHAVEASLSTPEAASQRLELLRIIATMVRDGQSVRLPRPSNPWRYRFCSF